MLNPRSHTESKLHLTFEEMGAQRVKCLARVHSQLVDFGLPVQCSLCSTTRDKLGRELKVGSPNRRGQKLY